MKKKLSTILLISAVLATVFAAPKKGKSNNIKLDPKKKFAIEGVELGSLGWTQKYASLNNKGEIIWKYDTGEDWLHYGWELRGTDMSQYAGLKIEFTSKEKQDIRFVVRNPAAVGDWTFPTQVGNVMYVMFNGVGKWYGDMENPDPVEGYEMYFLVEAKNKYSKTAIKSIELLSKIDYPDASNLDLLGVQFGSTSWQTFVIGNEITWPKGYNDGNAGWNLEGIDLSEYDRVRVELESNDVKGLEISFNQRDGKNYHAFNQQLEPNVFEADLSGEGASYKNEDSATPDKSEGLSIYLHSWNEKPRAKDQKTVVKSVQFLKGKRHVNENLQIEGANFISKWCSYVYDGGVIEWEWNGKEKYPCAGWNLKGIDLSEYEKIRVEVESTDFPLSLTLHQDGCDRGFPPIVPNVFEVNLDASEFNWTYPDKSKWDLSKGIEEIWIRADGLNKEGMKSKIKSVTLLKAGQGIKVPERLILNGAKFGTKRDRTVLDDDFAINWEKGNYAQCGWRLENLEGDILEIKVASTDVPLRLRIRENVNSNESSWLDDGTHIFRINLKNKKQINAKGGEKASEWDKMSKPFDFSQGCEIVLEAANGVYKEGKKTVVEYIKVE